MMHLLCFPFSGGSAVSYRGLGPSIGSIAISTFELPGRGRRFGEPLLEACEPMVDDLLRQVRPWLHEPYAFFGHSMGALLAYLVSLRLRREGLPTPAHLFVSGARSPSRTLVRDWHRLPRHEFHRVLSDLGGCPPAILADRDLMALYEPVLRADFAALANYRHEPAEPLDIPVTTLIGADDEVSDDEAADWQRETLRPLQLCRFAGDHFFIFRHWPEIRQIVSAQARAIDRDTCMP